MKSNKSYSATTIRTFAKLLKVIPYSVIHLQPTDEYGEILFNYGVIVVGNDSGCRMSVRLPYDVSAMLVDLFGLSNVLWGNSFHKDWNKVRFSPLSQLYFEQAIHYFSTYGVEFMGLKAIPIIPAEKILTNAEALPAKAAFTVVKVLSDEDYRKVINSYYQNTVAPHRDLIADLIRAMPEFNITPDNIASFELKIARYDQLGTVPTDGQDFLRYLIYRTTGSTMVIKNRQTISAIKGAARYDTAHVSTLLYKADLVELAKVFYRFKPLFLAFKSFPDCASTINKVRRLAEKYHTPMSDMNVQNFSALVSQGRIMDAEKVVAKASNRQLIKLLNFVDLKILALSNPKNNPDLEGGLPSLYNIRNGHIFVQRADAVKPSDSNNLVNMWTIVSTELTKRYKNILKGKTFYIPHNVHYAAPISEKQFIGNIPYGSAITGLPDGKVTAAVRWENYHGNRTDLDLHMQSLTESFGWNSSYRSHDVAYSGDMTDATNGAVEAYRFSRHDDQDYILTISNYTGESNVPFEFIVTQKEFKETSRWEARSADEVLDITDAVLPPIPLKFDVNNSMSIGMFTDDAFYFYGGDMTGSIVPKRELYKDYLRAMKRRLMGMIGIEEILKVAGATVLTTQTGVSIWEKEHTDTNEKVIDLSPSALTNRSLLDIVDAVD